MNKSEVCVKLTRKNCKKVLGILEMFGEPIGPVSRKELEDEIIDKFHTIALVGDTWCKCTIAPRSTYVNPRELRNILAKEHLKEGDICVFKQRGKEHIYRVDKIGDGNYPYIHNEKHNVAICFDNFLRYATDEEKALLEPKKVQVTEWSPQVDKGFISQAEQDGFKLYQTYTHEVWVNHYSDREFYVHYDEQSAYMSIGRRGEGATVKATLTYDIPMTKV